MTAGAATTTIYPTMLDADVAFIVADSGSRVVFAENAAQVQNLRDHRDELPDLARVVTFDGTSDETEGDADGWVITAERLAELGSQRLADEPAVLDERIEALTPEHLAVIIYTGYDRATQGRPAHPRRARLRGRRRRLGVPPQRGRPPVPVAAAVPRVREDPPDPAAADRLLHRGRRADRPDRRQPRRLQADVHGCRPAHLREGVRAYQHDVRARDRRKTLIDWALGVGGQVAAAKEKGDNPSGLLAVQHALADRLVLAKVRERFGGRVKFFISGSAALNPEVARWFSSVGLLIIEGYGLTETSAATCVNRPRPGRYVFGTVGWPLPGTEVRSATTASLVKGPGVMRGYHNRPDATAEVLSEDGWFHTGDIGSVDDRGSSRSPTGRRTSSRPPAGSTSPRR